MLNCFASILFRSLLVGFSGTWGRAPPALPPAPLDRGQSPLLAFAHDEELKMYNYGDLSIKNGAAKKQARRGAIDLNKTTPDRARLKYLEFVSAFPKGNLRLIFYYIASFDKLLGVVRNEIKNGKKIDPITIGYLKEAKKMVIHETATIQAKEISDIHFKLMIWKLLKKAENTHTSSLPDVDGIVTSIFGDTAQG